MKDRIILDLCGGTGSWSKPYKDAGYDVRLVTLPENDIRTYKTPAEVYGILAAPPCDEFSIAKNRDIKRDFPKGLEIVNACRDIINRYCPIFSCLENPRGHLKYFLGTPSYFFHPWWYGDPWTKGTHLWGKFNVPKRQFTKWSDVPKIEQLYIRPGRKRPSIAAFHKSSKKFIPEFDCFEAKTDAAFRAITPQGFAKAFFKANP